MFDNIFFFEYRTRQIKATNTIKKFISVNPCSDWVILCPPVPPQEIYQRLVCAVLSFGKCK